MYLLNYYYRINHLELTGNGGEVEIQILPNCPVFQGHFPGNPICPGVCNVEVIRECACLLTHQNLTIVRIKQCRFVNVLTPKSNEKLLVQVVTSPNQESVCVEATMSNANNLFVTFKGEMKA